MVQPLEAIGGEKGLWEVSKRTTMLALATQLLEDLRDIGVGTNDVEADARKREVQRRIKKGKCVEGIEIDNNNKKSAHKEMRST